MPKPIKVVLASLAIVVASALVLLTSPDATPAPTSAMPTGLLHCVTLTIDVDEVATSPAPGTAGDGWTFTARERVPCQGRRDCWFLVDVPDPGMYGDGRQHWIPVATTRSELANAGRECHDATR